MGHDGIYTGRARRSENLQNIGVSGLIQINPEQKLLAGPKARVLSDIAPPMLLRIPSLVNGDRHIAFCAPYFGRVHTPYGSS
jgi:hypothetical protein